MLTAKVVNASEVSKGKYLKEGDECKGSERKGGGRKVVSVLRVGNHFGA
jgi:hypothetical protein